MKSSAANSETKGGQEKQELRQRKGKNGNGDDEKMSFNALHYSNVGLFHSLDQLAEVFDIIHTLPRNAQAAYADAICRKAMEEKPNRIKGMVKEETELINDVGEEIAFPTWNATAMAYIAVHTKDDELRETVEHLLQKYTAWRRRERRTTTLIYVASWALLLLIVVSVLVYVAMYEQ